MGRDFSWLRAALAGFGVLRREPAVLVTWSLVGLVLDVAQQVLAVNADIFRKINPASLTALLLTLLGGLIGIGAMAILSAATYRAVLEPENRTRARMRFGRAELRLAVVWLVQGLLFLAALLVPVVPAVIATAAIAGRDYASFITLGSSLLGAVVGGLLLARLSVAGPMSLVEERWSLPSAWRLTRGRTWKIFSLHLCVVVATLAVYWACRALYALLMILLGGSFSLALIPRGTTVASVFQLETLIFTVISAVLGAAVAAVLYAPAAVIYRDLKGLAPDDQAAVFD